VKYSLNLFAILVGTVKAFELHDNSLTKIVFEQPRLSSITFFINCSSFQHESDNIISK